MASNTTKHSATPFLSFDYFYLSVRAAFICRQEIIQGLQVMILGRRIYAVYLPFIQYCSVLVNNTCNFAVKSYYNSFFLNEISLPKPLCGLKVDILRTHF